MVRQEEWDYRGKDGVKTQAGLLHPWIGHENNACLLRCQQVHRTTGNTFIYNETHIDFYRPFSLSPSLYPVLKSFIMKAHIEGSPLVLID